MDFYPNLPQAPTWIWMIICGLSCVASQRPRLISSCKSSLGAGRCTSSEDACQNLGGVISNSFLFSALPKTESSCDNGEHCCILLPLPNEDSCNSCGIAGVQDDDQQRLQNVEFPQRVLPNFDAIPWSSWKARTFDDDGFSFPTPRISRLSKINKWCWQVALMDRNGTLFGSGALIDGNNVLTLAHIVAGRRPQDIILLLGSTDFTRPFSGVSDVVWSTNPKQIFIHDQFDSITFANDVAVLRIPLAPCSQVNICPVCINDLPAGADLGLDRPDVCVATGWGPQNVIGTSSALRETNVKIVDNAQCFSMLSQMGVVGFTIPESQFCAQNVRANAKTPVSASCESDNGAPVVCLGGDKKWYLRGLMTVSTDPCALDSTKPFLATDVGMLFNWIKIAAANQDPRFGRLPESPQRRLMETNLRNFDYPRDNTPLQYFQGFQNGILPRSSQEFGRIPYGNPWLQIL